MNNCVKTHNTYNGKQSIDGMDRCLIPLEVVVEEEWFLSFNYQGHYSNNNRGKIKPDKV
jgi:hypothetical protein